MEDHHHHKHPCTSSTICSTPYTSHTTGCTTSTTRPSTTVKLVTFKPEFSGKPDEDAEAHLLRMNVWMDTHTFQEDVKVQRFCLTVLGEARLCYESLKPIAVDWNGLQAEFRQQYSRIGNTREHLFHAQRSFHFDKNYT